MITIPGNVRVWLATGHTDMRRGFRSLALMVDRLQHSAIFVAQTKSQDVRACGTRVRAP